MTINTATSECVARPNDWDPSSAADTSSAPTKSFARQLRALGQALERFSFSAFDLQIRNGSYLVIAKTDSPDRRALSFSQLIRQLLIWASFNRGFSSQDREIQLRFSLEDLHDFDLHGQGRRNDGTKVPDPHSISQLLRGAGSYLDNRNIKEPVHIAFMGRSLMIDYEMDRGGAAQVEHDLDYVYDHSVNMYLRRSNRPKPSTPAPPTVFVTARGIRV
jgi:hypothetical protein